MAAAHVHKLQRHRFKTGNIVYFCVLDCGFKVSVPLALGKKSICWRCGNPFVMSEYHIRLAKPHCNACHKTKGVNQHSLYEESGAIAPGTWAHPATGEPIAKEVEGLMSRLRAVTKTTEEDEDI